MRFARTALLSSSEVSPSCWLAVLGRLEDWSVCGLGMWTCSVTRFFAFSGCGGFLGEKTRRVSSSTEEGDSVNDSTSVPLAESMSCLICFLFSTNYKRWMPPNSDFTFNCLAMASELPSTRARAYFSVYTSYWCVCWRVWATRSASCVSSSVRWSASEVSTDSAQNSRESKYLST